MRVIIADDNDIALTVLEMALRGAGYEVAKARDGCEALELVRQDAARMLITDWEMPGLTGLDLCRAVRGEDLPGYVYTVLVTAHDRPAERVEGLTAGADDFICKPFDPAELLARVRAGERVLSLETREVAIFAMARLAESRDPETGAHLERVRGYSRELAQHLAARHQGQIDAGFVRLIYQTSPLHDIGKVGIPDSVLLKPGKLTESEFEVMKTHATIGAETLDAAVDRFPGVSFLKMARDIAGAHHERYDGSGYPRRLAGDDIPLSARIVAVADAYDAITSRRVYKPPVPHAEAKQRIAAASGTQFDPRVVGTFLNRADEFVTIAGRFSEGLAAAA